MAAVRAAISVGDIDAASLRNETPAACVDGLQRAAQAGVLKADHYLHMRLELAEENLLTMFEPYLQDDRLGLVCLMDHAPANGVLRYSEGSAGNGFNVTAMAIAAAGMQRRNPQAGC